MTPLRACAGLCCALVLLACQPAFCESLGSYRVFFAECRPPQCERPLIILRKFVRAGETFFLAVDPQTLATQLVPASGLGLTRISWDQVKVAAEGTPYGTAVEDAERHATPEHDAGIVHTLPPGNGVVLTIDLCPSSRPLDRQLFAAILSNFGPQEKPVPLGVAITGRWMHEHPNDLRWLVRLEQSNELAVTWINHSFNHRFDRTLPDSQNFLLARGTNLEFEILGTEAAMIENGIRPSIFFRFPGLVSNAELFQRVIGYGLIPVGSDAWLAKNQWPRVGSIILVHGNGNEPVGVERFLQLIATEKASIREGNWLLFDLRESILRSEQRQ